MIWRALTVGFAFATHEAEVAAVKANAACAVERAAAQRCSDQLLDCEAWRGGVSFSLATIINLLRGDL